MKKVLVVFDGNDVAPRFDFSLELLVVSVGADGKPAERKDLVLARPSAEALCRVVAAENVNAVICGGIEKDYLQYLGWKKVEVIHSVIGLAEEALDRYLKGALKPRDIL
jgi:predicted Fe-Mo cluster-binding NifX family protein